MSWFGVRNLYHFGVTPEGNNIYEERVICIKANDFDEAHIKGKKESETYSQENGFTSYTDQVVYKQDGESLIDGYEVWSELYESDKSMEEFYKEHYFKYDYEPNNT